MRCTPFTKTAALAVLLTLPILWPAPLRADEIFLKDGRRIRSDKVWQKDGFVRYRIPGGVMGIREDAVDRIVHGNTPERTETPRAVIDLNERLRRKRAPGNPVEEAAMATVSITTPAATGAGFFISENGHILTNRHVIRPDQRMARQLENRYQAAKSAISRLKRQIRNLRKKMADDEHWFSGVNRKLAALNEKDRFSSRAGAKEHQQKKIDLVNAYNARLPEFYGRQTRYRLLEQQYRRYQAEFDAMQKAYDNAPKKPVSEKRIRVILPDGTEHGIRVIAVSPRYDAALLKLDGYRTPFIRPADPKAMAVAEPVYAIGNPTGSLPNSVAAGTFKDSVSGGVLSGFRGEFLQIDAKIYPGNSGGPLVDGKGRVLGINTLKELTRKYEGLGYALSIAIALDEFREHIP